MLQEANRGAPHASAGGNCPSSLPGCSSAPRTLCPTNHDPVDEEKDTRRQEQMYPSWGFSREGGEGPDAKHDNGADYTEIHKAQGLTGVTWPPTFGAAAETRGEETDFLSQQAQRGGPTNWMTSCPSAGKTKGRVRVLYLSFGLQKNLFVPILEGPVARRGLSFEEPGAGSSR